ncbi:MAG: patatin family protein [Ruminococcaceae bacterium]|nr:patatin family protein [Oscillospiraceae bacterium]
MTKTGLVLEGGGLRGMYTAGVLDAFLERNIKFDYGIGVSAGAAYGISYISKQKGRNLEVCEKYINDKRYVSIANLIKEGALFGQKFVYEEIPLRLVPFDYNTYFNSSCDFFTGVTNVSTGRSEYFKLKDDKYKFNLFKATCALPLVSPLVELYNGYYLDGGISNPIPYKKALEDGCDKLTVVLTQHRGYIKNKQSNLGFIKFFYRKYPKIYEALKVRHEVYNKQIEEIRELEKKGIVKIICPNEPVGIKRIERDFEKIKNLYNKGYRDGMNY